MNLTKRIINCLFAAAKNVFTFFIVFIMLSSNLFSTSVNAAALSKELVLVENNIDDYQTIVKNIPADKDVYLLDSKKDGLAQIQKIVEGQKNISAIHLISHGNAGELNLGSLSLNNYNLKDYSSILKKIGLSLKKNGDLLLYGCDVAKGMTGMKFINNLANLTRLNVAASTNSTGNEKLGGDWLLEASSSPIHTKALSILQYKGLLDSVDFTGDAGDTNSNASAADFPSGSTPTTVTIKDNSSSNVLQVVADGTGMNLDNATNLGDSPVGMTGNYIKTDFGWNYTKSITFTVQGGKYFDFNSMDLEEANGEHATFKFTPDNNDSNSVTVNFNALDHNTINLSSNNNFKNICNVKITVTSNPDGFQANMDNIVLANIHSLGDPTYNVTYNGNGSSSGGVPSDGNNYYSGDTVAVTAVTLTRTHYTFAGWNTQADGNGTSYSAGGSFKITSNTTLYAKWIEDQKYSVTYNGNGNSSGTAPTDSNTYYSGDSATAAAVGDLTKTHYTFAGWNTNSDGSGTAISPGGSISITGNATLYAQWTEDPKYSVTYNGNGNSGGTVPTDSNTYYSGTSATVAVAGSLTRPHYSFSGWNTHSDGSGTAVSPGGSISITGNATLYAQWTEDPKYSVTYNGNGSNGGSVPTDSNTYYGGTSITAASAGSLTRTHYTFTCWNTAANGTGTNYTAGTNFSLTVNTTLYAQWIEDPKYSVTYNGNGNDGGIAPADSTTYYSTDSVTAVGAGSLTKTHYSFADWNTAANGTGTNYTAGSNFSLTANTTLYAQWTEDPKYTVTYNGNGNDGGSAPTDSNAYYSTDSVTAVGSSSLTRTHYTFAGWNTAANGTGINYTAGSNFSLTANTTLYAQWTEDPKYTVTYNGNGNDGGSVPADSNAYYCTDPVTAEGASSLTRTHYTFAGWNTAANGTGTAYTAGSNFSLTANTTLYAQWTEDPKYTVTYNGNGNDGGSVPADSNAYYSTDSVTTKGAGSLTRTHYSFAGWNTAANGTGTNYTAGSNFSLTANTTLYAQWTEDPKYTVTYNGNGNDGGSVPTDSNKYFNGDIAIGKDHSSLARMGYTFAGWNTSAIANGTHIGEGVNFNIAGDIILYAEWIRNNSTLNTSTAAFDKNILNQKDLSVAIALNGNVLTGIFNGTNALLVGTDYTISGNIINISKSYLSKQAVGAITLTFNFNGGASQNLLITIKDTTTFEAIFNSYDGSIENTQTAAIGSKLTEPAVPARVGYTFLGWYKEATCENKWDFAKDIVTSATALYEKWAISSYTVTFKDYNGTTIGTPQCVLYGNSAVAPANPTMIGYKFTGWDNSFNNVTGDLVVTAKYSSGYIYTFQGNSGSNNTSEVTTISAGYLLSGDNTLSLNNGVAHLTIPAGAIDITNISGDGYIKVSENIVSYSSSPLFNNLPIGKKMIGNPINLNIQVFNASGIMIRVLHQFANGENVRVAIKLSDDLIKNLDTNKLSMYYYDEAKNEWVNLGGSFYKNTNEFVFDTPHFTNFSLMESSTPVLPQTGQNIDNAFLVMLGTLFVLLGILLFALGNKKNLY